MEIIEKAGTCDKIMFFKSYCNYLCHITYSWTHLCAQLLLHRFKDCAGNFHKITRITWRRLHKGRHSYIIPIGLSQYNICRIHFAQIVMDALTSQKATIKLHFFDTQLHEPKKRCDSTFYIKHLNRVLNNNDISFCTLSSALKNCFRFFWASIFSCFSPNNIYHIAIRTEPFCLD